jgi:hypothetical protein
MTSQNINLSSWDTLYRKNVTYKLILIQTYKNFNQIYCHVYGGVHVTEMTGSSSDDWILLSVRLQPLLITLSHNTIAIPHTLQSLFTLIHTVYFQ